MIIHYANETKPWYNPEDIFADIWWKYARLTPFYESLLLKLIEKNNVEHNNLPKKTITIKSILQSIFSVKNEFNHKVWTILGLKIKFKRKNKTQF